MSRSNSIDDIGIKLNNLNESEYQMRSTQENQKSDQTKRVSFVLSQTGNQIAVGADGLPLSLAPEDSPLNQISSLDNNKDNNNNSKDDDNKLVNEIDEEYEYYYSDEESDGKALKDVADIETGLKRHRKKRRIDQINVKKVGDLSQVMSLLNSLLGAGILSVPNSFTNTGIIPSIILLLLMAFLSYVATYMVIVLQHETNSIGLPDMASKLLGKWGSLSLSILSLFFLIAAQMAYIILGGNMLESWFMLAKIDIASNMWRRAALICVYALVLPILMTIPRNRCYLRYFAPVTVFSIIFFCVVLVFKGAVSIKENKGINSTVKISIINLNLFSSLAIYGLTFALPIVCLPVFQQFDKKVKRRSKVSIFAITGCFFLVLVPGLFGYFQFGQETKGNIMQNFPDNDILIILVRIAFFLVVSFAYPAVGQSTMVSWAQLCFNDCRVDFLVWWKRTIVLCLANGIPLLVAMFLANAKPALAIGGAMGGCVVDFLFPSIMWIVNSKQKWYGSAKNVMCALFAVFGLVVAVISTYQAVMDAIAAFS